LAPNGAAVAGKQEQRTVFWKKTSRLDRRQQVMEDLIDLDLLERRIRMNKAVADGDIRADEMETLLRTASRLDDLRVMPIPTALSSRPSAELIGMPAGADEPTASKRGNGARTRRRVALDVSPDVVVVSAARADGMRSLTTGRKGQSSGDIMHRLAVIGDEEARKVRARRPVAVPVAEDDGPNIAWLRPSTQS
jgi:hypothetical protein